MDTRAYACFAEFYLIKGEFTEAQEMLDLGFKVDSAEFHLLGLQGVLFAQTGNGDRARDVVKVLNSNRSESKRPLALVPIYAALGDLDRAFEALMRAAETHAWSALIKSHPFYANMRTDPRFLEFCARVGIPAGS